MENPKQKALVQQLKKASIENNSRIWKRIALELERPVKRRRIVNLSRIDKYCTDDEIIIVPGKVLGMGNLTKKVTIAAFRFSDQARDKIRSCGSKAVAIDDLLKKNPKGSKIRIIG